MRWPVAPAADAVPPGSGTSRRCLPSMRGARLRGRRRCADSARSAARAKTQTRSARRLRYGIRSVAGHVARRGSVTARRSARRRIVRASSSAALVGVSPGTTNSLGISMLASSSRRSPRRPRPSLGRDPGLAVLEAVPGVGVGGQLRADDEQLALEAQDQVAEAAEAGGRSRTGRLTPSYARASRGRRWPRRWSRRPRRAGRPWRSARRRTGGPWCRRRRGRSRRRNRSGCGGSSADNRFARVCSVTTSGPRRADPSARRGA